MNDNDIEENSVQITINTANITKIANDLADYCKYLFKFFKNATQSVWSRIK